MTQDEMRAHYVRFVENAILKYATHDLQPIWETDEEWRDHVPLGTDMKLIDSLCQVPLVRSCVQYAMAYQHYGQADQMRKWLVEIFGEEKVREANRLANPEGLL
jgi:hypothetical protein